MQYGNETTVAALMWRLKASSASRSTEDVNLTRLWTLNYTEKPTM